MMYTRTILIGAAALAFLVIGVIVALKNAEIK